MKVSCSKKKTDIFKNIGFLKWLLIFYNVKFVISLAPKEPPEANTVSPVVSE